MIAANVIWNMTLGTQASFVTPLSDQSSKGLAIRPPSQLSLPNASDQPQSTKTMATIANATNDIIIMFRTDFERVIPP